MTASATIAEAARDYYERRKWKPVPISRKTKRPIEKEWQKRPYDPKQFNGNDRNVGIQLGKVSGGLTDVDLDCMEAIALAPKFLPPTSAIFGRKSKPASHHLYVTDLCETDVGAVIQFPQYIGGKSDGMLVELRVGGKRQGEYKGATTVAPPSLHESGETVTWEREGEPAKVAGDKLVHMVRKLAVASLLKRHYPGDGSRHKGALAIGGVLARAGWNADDIGHVVEQAARAVGDDEVADRVATAKGAVGANANGTDVAGLQSAREAWGDIVADTLGHWLKLRTSRGASVLLPSPNMPMAVARRFVERRCLHDGALTLRHWRGTWWQWRRSHWSEREDLEVKALLYAFTEHARYQNAEGEIVPWAPNTKKIGDLSNALATIILLAPEVDQPTWLDGRASGTIVAVANGLLDVTTRELIPHSPQFFNYAAVPFDYDKDAPRPQRWHEFLDALWPDEPAAADVLGEWFGYVISGRLDLQKIFVMVGPTRGGRGVIARIETALIGKDNVAGPTLTSLGTESGLMPLIGKSLAIISDARSGGGKDSSIVVERMLSISGEDTLDINRKYKKHWIGKLGVRLHVISNVLPRFADASGAIVGRIVLLLTTRSWLGKEDLDLERNLRGELSGILNWSLDGLQRLTADNENQFTRFAAADEAIIQMRDLASPVGAFAREKCKLGTGDEYEVATDTLYDVHKTWRVENDYPKIDKGRFGRDLRAACPSVRKTRPRDKTKRYHVYQGIRLRTEKDDAEEGESSLSRSRIRELADWYREQTSRRYNDGSLDQAALDADLRAILWEEIASPDQVEIAFQQVTDMALAM